MITLKEVAAEAGVSVRSVSVVLNGKENRISAPMVDKIRRIAAKLNYRPNFMARAVRTRKTYQIGVLVCELSNPLTGQLVEAIEANLSRFGYKLLLGLTNREPGAAKAYLRDFSQGMVDGILNQDPQVDDALLRQTNVAVPYLHFLRPSPHFVIKPNMALGVHLALEHLWELGHRKIGFLSGPQSDISSTERLEGFKSFFNHKSLRRKTGIIEYGDWTFASGLEGGKVLLDKKCTAIFGANDLMAVGAIKAAQGRKLIVPKDVAVAGFDDSLTALLADPPLTSVRLPLPEIIKESVEYLLSRIEGKATKKTLVFQPDLIVRASTQGKSDISDGV